MIWIILVVSIFLFFDLMLDFGISQRILALTKLFDVVYTEDFDGEVRLRVASHASTVFRPKPRLTVTGIGPDRGEMMSNGTIKGHCYLKRWKKYYLTPQTKKILYENTEGTNVY